MVGHCQGGMENMEKATKCNLITQVYLKTVSMCVWRCAVIWNAFVLVSFKFLQCYDNDTVG